MQSKWVSGGQLYIKKDCVWEWNCGNN